MQIDTGCLLKNTIGIQEITGKPENSHLIFDEIKYTNPARAVSEV
jgi:hypothetical protein